MDLGLKNRNAVITVSSQGIGYAIAEALAREGTNIAISARGAERLEAARETLAAHGTEVVAVTTDFSSNAGCKHFVDEAAEKLGGIDILVNKVRGVTTDDVRAAIASKTLLGRWADPGEIGDVAAFLVSARNSYMTGTTVEVCGGFNRYI